MKIEAKAKSKINIYNFIIYKCVSYIYKQIMALMFDFTDFYLDFTVGLYTFIMYI